MYPSLKNRIINHYSTGTSGVRVHQDVLLTSGLGRGFYRNYDLLNLNKAVAAIESGESYRKASEMFGVPRSTLYDHSVGRVGASKSGPKPYLTVEEEEELVKFLDVHSRIGYPYTRKHVIFLVQEVVNDKGINTTVSNGWWEGFLRRHPSLRLRTAVPLSVARAIATDENMIECYFDKLQETLTANDIFDKPCNIFNCDETGFALSPKAPKVVATLGTKAVSHLTSNTKSQITVLVCTNASGYALPPFVIFDRKTLNPQMTIGEVPGTLYGLSSKGWIDRSLFSDWFFNHFLAYVPALRPLILILDGHSSHYCPEVIRAASEQQIIIFALPPNTTHLTQPLDKGPFSPLKTAWKEVCHNFTIKNPGRTISRYDFSKLFSEAWLKAMTVKNIIAGFKTTGICPFNRKVITFHQQFQPLEVVKKSKLAYHPLYSPKIQTPSRVNICMPADETSSPLNFDYDSEDGTNLDQCILKEPVTSFGRFFNKYPIPEHPSKLHRDKPKSSGSVLTSAENLKIIEEKERKKREAVFKKEERKRKREEKAMLKNVKGNSVGKDKFFVKTKKLDVDAYDADFDFEEVPSKKLMMSIDCGNSDTEMDISHNENFVKSLLEDEYSDVDKIIPRKLTKLRDYNERTEITNESFGICIYV
jgi:hypothetical protein